MTELKKMTKLKSASIVVKTVSAEGGSSEATYRSNVHGSPMPASPEGTLVNAGVALARAACIAGVGQAFIDDTAAEVKRVHDWLIEKGYETVPLADETKVLHDLAERLGYNVSRQCCGVGQAAFETRRAAEIEESKGHDYEALWDSWWKESCSNPDGTLNLDQIKRELSDYAVLLNFVPKVYDHVTGGRISKPLTWPSVVCSVADDHLNAVVYDTTKELQEILDADTEKPWVRDNEDVYSTLLLISIDVPIGIIPHWTDEQCKQAEDYALAVHLHASDNDEVVVPKMPEFLRPFES